MDKINKLYFILMLLVTFCLLPLLQIGQTKSTDIKTINGKKYYIHIVEKGQSLYAIAKTYSMDINSVLAENDDAIDGLKNGQTLKIPFESLLPKQQENLDTSKYIYHKVLKGETLYAICHKYNTDETTIKSLNPSIHNGLKEGDQLVITEKVNKKNAHPIEVSSLNNFSSISSYTVLPGETVYSISKKINVSTESITKWNPDVKDGIKVGQVLSIGKIKTDAVSSAKPLLVEKEKITTDTIRFKKDKKTAYQIGLFLPFKLEESEAITIEDLVRSKSSFPNAQNISLDFYFGFKKAVDSLISKDFDVSISLFDIQENDSTKVEAICNTPEFKKLDIIFGPLYAGVFKQLSMKAKVLQIPCVSPLTQQSKILYNNTLVSKVNPSQYTIIERLADFCLDSLRLNSKICIVNATQKDAPYVKAFKKRYNDGILKINKSIKDTISELKGLSAVKNSFVIEKNNVVVLLTNNPVYLQDFITQLSVSSSKKNVILLGFESVTSIDNLDQGYLNDLNFHFATANHIDYTDINTIDLIKQYQQMYFSDPSESYFEGFDIGMYYLNNLKLKGLDMFINLEQLTYTGVASGFKFSRPDVSSGYENRAISIYKYSNFKLKKLGWK